MSKKQRNRKLVAQNKRNRIINRRYSSIIKSLSKLFKNKIKSFQNETDLEKKINIKQETLNLVSTLYSIIDKAVKKDVIHKNNAARKKSKIYKLSNTVNIN
jgi:small subunit ribosomal protein S20